jgi:hypothetical protein
METKNSQKISQYFQCEKCNYISSRLCDYKKHLLTRKHIYGKGGNTEETEETKKVSQNTQFFTCQYCKRKYTCRSGLWKHNKICKQYKKYQQINNSNNFEESNKNTTELIVKIIEENSHLMTKIANDNLELQTIIKDLIQNGLANYVVMNTNTNTNSNNVNSNNTFNLQFYLNETCKDAMNLSEFVNSITPTLEELETTGRDGYVKGISNIVVTRLNTIKMNEKPIHCSDSKREILYIKENNIWNKEMDNKPLLTNAIKRIAHKNICNILEWKNKHPDCSNSDSRKNDLFLKIVSNTMSGSTEEESNKNYEKIISNVAKNVIINKQQCINNV